MSAASAVGGAAAARGKACLHPGEFVALLTLEAECISRVAVQFDDIVGGNAGRLVEIVDVLGYDRRRLAGAIEACDCTMAATGPGCRKLLLQGKPPSLRLVPHLLAGKELVERDRAKL